ncbi:MAG: membrane dipeptidase [bacterium]|nr:membrane dipeptidase [bacterium]
MRRLQRETVTVAMHTDLIADVSERRSLGETRILARRHAEVFRQAGVRCICDHVIGETFETQSFPTRDLLTAFSGGKLYNPSLLKHSLKILEGMLADLDESQAAFGLAHTAADIRRLAADGKIAVVLSTQGVTPLEDEPALLDVYHRLGLRVVGMANIHGNGAVGSYLANPSYGLSQLGRGIVTRACRLKMVVDVSYVSRQGFWDIVDLVDGPIIASCTNAVAVHGFSGNFTDDQLRAVAQKGGVIGLHANGKLVSSSPKPTLSEFVDHIDHIAAVVGIDHVGLGPNIVEPTFYPTEAYERLFSDVGVWRAVYPEGFGSYSELSNVTAELLRRGYADADVQKVLGDNALRVYEDVWGS